VRQSVNEGHGGEPYLLEVKNLRKQFEVGRRLGSSRAILRAVDDVSFGVRQGEVLGLLGESGCGKTTTARMILRLVRPSAGRILLGGKETSSMPVNELRRLVQIIFQDPTDSLNPAFKVRRIIGEALRRTATPRSSWPSVIDRLLGDVGLSPDTAVKFPRQLSGGQRQRVGIARALAVGPRLIVADEPVSALDVSVQAQILNLFIDLKQKFALTYIFISHDVNVLRYICDRVVVMYLGRIVESGPIDYVFERPQHPYTEALLNSAPGLHQGHVEFKSLPRGDLPTGFVIPSGCRYHPRCPRAAHICHETEPKLESRFTTSLVACHFPTRSLDFQHDATVAESPGLRDTP
jgi:oligopeptide/dipeptide ABC transporter ATP-binding protein